MSGFYPYDGGVAGAPGEPISGGSMSFGFNAVFTENVTILPLPVNAADDTAAAVAGVAIGQLYRNGSVLMIRTI